MSNLQIWMTRTVALLVAWAFVLMLAAMAGTVIGHRIWPFVVFWLWFGLLVMLRSARSHPMPDGKFVDVIGAFAMLWWAAKWPFHLFEK